MTILRMNFSGEVRKSNIKKIGGKDAVEFQIMKSNYAREGEERTYTWVRVTLFDPKPWQIVQCEDGKFVSGSGEFTLRSYEKDGVKRQSAEIRCTSFDLDGARTEEATATPVKRPAPTKQAAADSGDDGLPF